jgi:hypothetical protein
MRRSTVLRLLLQLVFLDKSSGLVTAFGVTKFIIVRFWSHFVVLLKLDFEPHLRL